MNDNDLLGTEIDAISLIHSELWASSSQNESLDGDGCSEEIEWATIGEAEANKKITITFDYPTLKMIKHLKPFYIAQINGKTLSIFFVDERAILNIMSLTTLKKLGRRQKELIATNMKMTNFTGGATPTLGILLEEPCIQHSISWVPNQHILCCGREIGFI